MERRNEQPQVPYPDCDVRPVGGALRRVPVVPGVLTMLARSPQDEPQHALHVTDYYCTLALALLRATGACGRRAKRKLTDYEFDHNQFNRENGEGEIY